MKQKNQKHISKNINAHKHIHTTIYIYIYERNNQKINEPNYKKIKKNHNTNMKIEINKNISTHIYIQTYKPNQIKAGIQTISITTALVLKGLGFRSSTLMNGYTIDFNNSHNYYPKF